MYDYQRQHSATNNNNKQRNSSTADVRLLTRDLRKSCNKYEQKINSLWSLIRWHARLELLLKTTINTIMCTTAVYFNQNAYTKNCTFSRLSIGDWRFFMKPRRVIKNLKYKCHLRISHIENEQFLVYILKRTIILLGKIFTIFNRDLTGSVVSAYFWLGH